MRIVQPAGWKRPSGYSSGICASGTYLFIAGQIGWAADGSMAEELAEQTAQALRNIVAVLAAAAARPDHLVRMTWYVTDKREYLAAAQAIGSAYREIIGPHYPAMTLVEVSALLEDGAKIEIEATAVLPEAT